VGKTVLVVDDEPDVVVFLTTFLEDNGFKTFSAHDGKEGLEMAQKIRPDLITLDVTMPGKSGIAVFTEMRTDPRTANIPVFIVTGVMDFRELVYHRQVPPPDGYMSKPIDKDTLLLNIRKILSHHKAEVTV
jgi:DNA-binding response OmpR family regulator